MIAYNFHGDGPDGDDFEFKPRVGSRAGQTAAQLRRGRTARARHRTLALALAGLAVATLLVLTYLSFMSNIYRLNYQLHALDRRRAVLLEASARLDDRIAQLESRDRLAALADRLGMRDPRRFAVATVPPAAVERPHGLAFLPIAANWLH